MFRSAKRIVFDLEQIQSNGGVMIAPEIDIFGLKIATSQIIGRPIDYRIKDFLTALNVDLSRVIVSDVYLVRISGNFCIKREQVKEFLAQNPDLASQEPAQVSFLPFSKHLADDAQADIVAHKKEFAVAGPHVTLSIKLNIIQAERELSMKAKKAVQLSTSFLRAGNELRIDAEEKLCAEGVVYNFQSTDGKSVDFGIMGSMYAQKRMALHSAEMSFADCKVSAGEDLMVSSKEGRGRATLSMNNSIEFYNKPYEDKSKIEQSFPVYKA